MSKTDEVKQHRGAADKSKQHCTCRGADDGRPMIRCDNCDDWFHFSCVGIDDETAEDISTFICQPCVAKSNRKTTFSWELTDDELTSAVSTATPKPKPLATPTFADHSDSDKEMRDDDGEYTEEHQLTRIRRGRQNRQDDPEQANRKRKATSTINSTPKRKKTITKSPSPLSDPVRKYCYGKLYDVLEPIFLEYRAKDGDAIVDDETAKTSASRYTTELENAVFNNYSEPDKKGARSAGTKYKERFRMLTFNLGQADRVSLRTGIGTGTISAADLSIMSSVDLANEQAKQDMEKAAQEALHQSILKVQTSFPRAKITHKGEEIIENNTLEDLQRAGEEEDRERMRMRLRVRTGSILDGTADAAGAATSSVLGESSPVQLDKTTPTIFDENGVAAGMSPITPVTIGNITSSPVQEVKSPTEVNRVGVLGPRPSFDLNALWSANDSGGGQWRDENVTRNEDDQSDVEMDLDDEVAENQDFGMFLDGVEEKSRVSPISPESTTTPTVWSGELVMPLDPNPPLIVNANVRQVGGRRLGTSSAVWNLLFKTNKALIEGRVPTDRSTKYLVTTRLNANKELIVVTFTPTEDTKPKFAELFDFLVKKDRHGLIFPWSANPPPSAPGKDMYLIPLKAEQSLPEFIDLLDHVQIPKKRDDDTLLGVFVLSKGRIVVPAETSAPLSQPTAQNEAVSSLLASANPVPYGGHPGPYPPYPTAPSSPPAVAPPVVAPSAAALSALTDSIRNMSQDQINLILKGLSMAAANNPPVPPPVAPPSWLAPVPAPNLPYQAPIQPDSFSPPRNYPPPRYDDDHYRERRASPPYKSRPSRGRGRDDRFDRGRGPRDRRSGSTSGDYGPRSADGGWGRRRTTASTDDF